MHPLSALLAISLDAIWTLIEIPSGAMLPFAVVLTSFFLFLVSSFIIFLVQIIVAKEHPVIAFVKGMAIGVAVAVPFPVFGVLGGSASLIGSLGHKMLKATLEEKQDDANIIDTTLVSDDK